jgi:hypothetical protein
MAKCEVCIRLQNLPSSPITVETLRATSPGWEPGKPRQRRIRYPIVKKTTPKPRKEQAKSA